MILAVILIILMAKFMIMHVTISAIYQKLRRKLINQG